MKIKFLGTSGYYPTEHRHTSCVFLPEEGIALDAGTGFFRIKEQIKTKKLDVLLSHYHQDHIFGLTFMIGTLYNINPNVTVYGPKGIKNLEKRLNFPIKFKDHPFKISIKKISDEFNLENITVRTKLFPHKEERSAAYRIEKDGKVLSYVTDLTASEEEITLIKNSDLLIHECYFPEQHKEFAKKTYHSYTTLVANIAKEAGVKKLALYHTSPLTTEKELLSYVDECSKIFPNTFLPSDNQEAII